MVDVGELGRLAWRDWAIDEIPSSGTHQPSKVDIRTFAEAVELQKVSVVNNIAALRLYTGSAAGFLVRSRAAFSDGGGGLFLLDPTDTTSNDDGVLIVINGLGQRCRRITGGAWNVKWWGALGDGVANDTVALQAALDALPVHQAELYLPAGHYLTGPLELPVIFNFTIRGAGRETTSISLTSAGTLLSISGANFATVEDIGFLLDGDPHSVANTTGVLVADGTGNLTFNRCNFRGFAVSGLKIAGEVDGASSGNNVTNCNFINNGEKQLHCIYAHDFNIAGNQFGTNTGITHAQYGSYFENCGAGAYTGDNKHWNNVVGSHWEDCSLTRIEVNRFEESDHENLSMEGGSKNIVKGNTIFTGSKSGDGLYSYVVISNSEGLSFEGNTISSWNAAYGAYCVAFLNTNTNLHFADNSAPNGYDVANKGPYYFGGDTAANGLTGDRVMQIVSGIDLATNTTYSLGTNGATFAAWLSAMASGGLYQVAYAKMITTVTPGSGHTYTWTLQKSNVDTAMTATQSDGPFEASLFQPTQPVLTDPGDYLSMRGALSNGAAPTAAFGYVVLVKR